MHNQVDSALQALEGRGGLGDIIGHLLGGKTEGTDLGGKCGDVTGFTTDNANLN